MTRGADWFSRAASRHGATHRERRPTIRARRPASSLETLGRSFEHQALTNRGPLLKAATWACQLQGSGEREIDLDAIMMCDADAIIVDYSRDGSAARAFSAAEVAAMKVRRNGRRKQIIAYMSIGEAEEARYYWQRSWVRRGVKTKSAPNWLYRVNEGGWQGNWRVRFWDPQWQNLIVDGENSFLDRIITAGFDGVFLDIIEACEYWEDDERGADRKAGASDLMVAFVSRIADHARLKRGRREFLVVPNGDFLLEHAAYRAKISAIMREDVIYRQVNRADEPPRVAKRPREGEDGVDSIAARLNMAAPDDLPVLAIEYLLDRDEDRAAIPETASALRSLAPNVLPYFSTRNLDRLWPPFDTVNA